MAFTKITLLITGLLAALSLTGQTDSLGQWSSLQSFSKGTYVTETDESIVYTTGNAMFYLDKEDLSFTRLTRIDGLAGGRINLVKYHPPTATLIIVYENSTIDLLRDGRFTTLRQIDNFNFSGDKRIYDVAFGADNRVYLAAGYGLSALSLNDETFAFTTFTGVRVDGVAEYDGRVYAATPEGLYRAPLTGVNLNDFNRWNLLGPDEGLPGDYSSNSVTTWRDQLYFAVGDSIWQLNDGGVRSFYNEPPAGTRLTYLSAGPTRLLAGYRCTSGGCFDSDIIALEETPGQYQRLTTCANLTNYAVEDEAGRIWFGDDIAQVRYLTGIGGECQLMRYPGPPNDFNYRLLHDGTSLWVAPGQLGENISPVYDFNGVYRYMDRSWRSYNIYNTPAFTGRDGVRGTGDDDVPTIIDVDYDPVNQVHYFSSFFEGVIALEADGTASYFDESNSSLQVAPQAGPSRIRAAGAVTDPQGYTYFAVSQAAENGIVSVRSPDGTWAALGQSCGINLAIAIDIDPQGYLWVVHRTGEEGGVTVIDPMGTPMDPSDDRCRTFTASNSALPTNQTRSVAVDVRGSVWVGTATGIVTFDCNAQVFDTDRCQGYLPPVESEDGFGAYLLETEEIRTIAVDGGNRKWIGTNGGAYLLSEDGREQLLFFDRGNSPLLDNTVRDIAIDPGSGTVYFGTELGVISYRGNATAATPNFATDLVVFPNPVEPGYGGPIAINGLARNARVKITDLSGKLVNEGLATGGQFSWSGEDYTGRRVTSGVYLVFASSNVTVSSDNPGAAVGKIVFLR